jgi:hypothetical protein
VLIGTHLYKNAGACACVCARMHVCVCEREREQKCLPITEVYMYMCTLGGLLQNILVWRNGGPTLHSVENTLRIAKQQCLSRMQGISPSPTSQSALVPPLLQVQTIRFYTGHENRTSATSWLPSFVSHWHITIRFLIVQPIVLVTVIAQLLWQNFM